MQIKDIASRAFSLYTSSRKLNEIKREVLERKIEYVIVMKGSNILKVFSVNKVIKNNCSDNNIELEKIEGEEKFSIIGENEDVINLTEITNDIVVVANPGEIPCAVLDNIKNIKKIIHELNNNNNKSKIDNTVIGYKEIFKHLDEEIIVSDKNGVILLVNPKAEQVMGIKESDTVGRKLQELVKEKIFTPSAALEVLKTKKKVNLRTTLKSGENRLSTAVPIFDENGEIAFAVCTSKNVKEIVDLNKKLLQKKNELQQKNIEINRLQQEAMAQINFIYGSQKMSNVINKIIKIAPMDSIIFIQGETGVGKEVVAKTIHYYSNRKNSPFIKINCGLIPENLLESELFGYEGGAFSGAKKSGKEGKVELAHNGTLFLDEIGEMPLSLQVKLLEFLQDSEITRVGGTKRIKINTRVITATNRNLRKMVDEGNFRMDLFYRLNVVPIKIPPLRERIDDIPILAEYFLKKFNNKYNMEKRLDSQIINKMLGYNWPGNVRELEHIMERLVAMSDTDQISHNCFDEIVSDRDRTQGKVICTNIIPYKQAKRELEKQLVKRAYDMFNSTYKAAEALDINQSTVVKILKRLKQQEQK